MVDNIKSYENLYGELINQISEENFQVKFTNDKMAIINYNNSESCRKTINLLQNNNFSFDTYKIKQSQPIRVMAKNLHCSCKAENIVKP